MSKIFSGSDVVSANAAEAKKDYKSPYLSVLPVIDTRMPSNNVANDFGAARNS